MNVEETFTIYTPVIVFTLIMAFAYGLQSYMWWRRIHRRNRKGN